MANSYRIRVVENIGADSIRTFGTVGNIIEVQDGIIHDLRGYRWCSPSLEPYSSVEQINEVFSSTKKRWFDTSFELVKE